MVLDYLSGASVAGGKMKEIGTTSWNSLNTDAANRSLFTSIPGWNRYYIGYYFTIGGSGNWRSEPGP